MNTKVDKNNAMNQTQESIDAGNISYIKDEVKIDKSLLKPKNGSFFVTRDIHGSYMRLLDEVNSCAPEYKRYLKKLSINDLLEIILEELDDKFKSQLKFTRLTGGAKQKLLRNRYEQQNEAISDDEWEDIKMSVNFQKFKKENIDCFDIF